MLVQRRNKKDRDQLHGLRMDIFYNPQTFNRKRRLFISPPYSLIPGLLVWWKSSNGISNFGALNDTNRPGISTLPTSSSIDYSSNSTWSQIRWRCTQQDAGRSQHTTDQGSAVAQHYLLNYSFCISIVPVITTDPRTDGSRTEIIWHIPSDLGSVLVARRRSFQYASLPAHVSNTSRPMI